MKVTNLITNTKQSLIEQTIALPCYNARDIIFISIESLIKQVNVNYSWELLVCEEPHEKEVGLEYFSKWTKVLEEKGCVSFQYLYLDNHVNLAKKWQIMSKLSDNNSKSFLLWEADDYSPSIRMSLTYQYINKEDYDWMDFTKGFFYSIPLEKLILYNINRKTNLFKSVKLSLIKFIPDREKRKGTDNFLRKVALYTKGSPLKKKNIDTLYMDAICTDGENTLSTKRYKFYNEPKLLFEATKLELKDLHISLGVYAKLKPSIKLFE